MSDTNREAMNYSERRTGMGGDTPQPQDTNAWKWVSANSLIHVHCDDLIEIASKL